MTRSTTSCRSWAEALGSAADPALFDRLGHPFADEAPLLLALTHRSWCAERGEPHSNERLEFLGDAVLAIIVTDHLFTSHPELPEGDLAKIRAAVVNEAALATVAIDLGLGDALRLGKGEDASGGRGKASILADAMEAVIGAVYVDGGLDAARDVVLPLFAPLMESAVAEPGGGDHKSELQELVARLGDPAPVYDLADEGPDHDKRFFARVLVGDVVVGEGEGRSKKTAEQAAARAALAHFAHVTVPGHEGGPDHA